MRFSDLDRSSWEENHQFYDTCLLPFTGLTGLESPPEMTAALERLRDLLDLIEKPFQGRIVTYPAVQYIGTGYIGLINEICRNVKSSGFQYVIVVTADSKAADQENFESDLVLTLHDISASQNRGVNPTVGERILQMWKDVK
ncbi:DUF2487 family protein [Paenibacillus sp. LC-T2]|uniref:DUF2487 family protein n=2 Tax=Paenibacillus monticola TaxID=2666075 RepID=A0A7X2L1G7_9BACL|nr:DUF2487 family protein [Paenibacillus monticola]